jgi:hypothetical protein
LCRAMQMPMLTIGDTLSLPQALLGRSKPEPSVVPDVWIVTLDAHQGALTALLDVLRSAGADVRFIIARRSLESPGESVRLVPRLSATIIPGR